MHGLDGGVKFQVAVQLFVVVLGRQRRLRVDVYIMTSIWGTLQVVAA